MKDHVEFAINQSTLSSLERAVIIHRFGLCGEFEKTLEETAKITSELGVCTAMGVKKVQDRALFKLQDEPLIVEAYKTT